jgi:hypothetical protein
MLPYYCDVEYIMRMTTPGISNPTVGVINDLSSCVSSMSTDYPTVLASANDKWAAIRWGGGARRAADDRWEDATKKAKVLGQTLREAAQALTEYQHEVTKAAKEIRRGWMAEEDLRNAIAGYATLSRDEDTLRQWEAMREDLKTTFWISEPLEFLAKLRGTITPEIVQAADLKADEAHEHYHMAMLMENVARQVLRRHLADLRTELPRVRQPDDFSWGW